MTDDEEIAPGLVLFFEPEDLSRFGAQYTPLTRWSTPMIGGHYFVCTGVDEVARTGEWVPLVSRNGPGRIDVTHLKRGYWGVHVRPPRPTFCLPIQHWRMRNATALACAARSDTSRPSRRNYLDPAAVEIIVARLERCEAERAAGTG